MINDIIDEIKSRITIREMAESEGLELKKSSGGRYTSPCCFHDEKKPSLTFYTDTNTFICFGCGKSGDVINFYAERYHLSIQEAIKQLAGKVRGYTKQKGLRESQKSRDPKKKQSKLDPDRVYRALKEFCGELDQESRAYLTSQSRGLTDETIKQFSIFSIKDYKKAREFLINRFSNSTDNEDLKGLGLFSKTANRFLFIRHKIIIPTIENGKITALRGRYFFEGQTDPDYHFGKYHSTKEIWHKLFNADILKTLGEKALANKKGDRVYLCEGEFDTMVLQQHGHNAIGLLGVGNYGEETIKRLNDFDLIVAFDNEEGSRKEAKNISNIFYKQTRRIADRVKLPDGIKDITELFIYKAKQLEASNL